MNTGISTIKNPRMVGHLRNKNKMYPKSIPFLVFLAMPEHSTVPSILNTRIIRVS